MLEIIKYQLLSFARQAGGKFFRPVLVLGVLSLCGCALAGPTEQRFEKIEADLDRQKAQGTSLALLEDRLNIVQIQLDQLLDSKVQANSTPPPARSLAASTASTPSVSQSSETAPGQPQAAVEALKALAQEHSPEGEAAKAPGITPDQQVAVTAESVFKSTPDPVSSQALESAPAGPLVSAHSAGASTADHPSQSAVDAPYQPLAGSPGFEIKTGGRVIQPRPAAQSKPAQAVPIQTTMAQAEPVKVDPPSIAGKDVLKADAPDDPDKDYNSALAVFESGRPVQAEPMFRAFIERNPGNRLVPNAMYWLGECHYGQKQYDYAILTFKDVIAKFPGHPKAAAAMLKTGFSYERMGDKSNAVFYLQVLLDEYPSSEPAALARKKLASLGSAAR